MPDKNSSSCNVIEWGVKLKEEQIAWLQSFEIRLATRAPKIDLVRPSIRKKPEPIVVSDTDKKLHAAVYG